MAGMRAVSGVPHVTNGGNPRLTELVAEDGLAATRSEMVVAQRISAGRAGSSRGGGVRPPGHRASCLQPASSSRPTVTHAGLADDLAGPGQRGEFDVMRVDSSQSHVTEPSNAATAVKVNRTVPARKPSDGRMRGGEIPGMARYATIRTM